MPRSEDIRAMLARIPDRKQIALFLLAALWLSLEFVGLGPFSYVKIADGGDAVIPMHLAMAHPSFSPKTSLWLPWVACGVDRLTNGLELTHFTTLAPLVLPGWLVYQVLRVLQIFIGGYFTFKLARERLGLDGLSSVMAGLIMCSWTDVDVGGHSAYAFLPFMLWALERIGEIRGGPAWAMALGLGLLSAAFSSLIATTPYCLEGFVIWFAIRGRFTPRLWLLCGVFFAASTLPHLQGVWAVLANGTGSQRSGWRWSMQGLTRFLRDPAVQISAVLAAAGMVCGGWKDRSLWRLAAGLLACVGGGDALTWLMSFFEKSLGLLASVPMSRIKFLIPLFAGLCAAGGLAHLPLRADSRRGSARVWGFAIVAAFLFWDSVQVKLPYLHDWYFQGGYTANYASPVLRDLASRGEKPFRVASFTHGLLPAYAWAYGLETVDGYVSVYPSSYHRFWGKVIEPLLGEQKSYARRFMAGSYHLYLFLQDATVFPHGVPFSRFYRLSLLSLLNARYIVSRYPLLDQDLAPVHEPAPWPAASRAARARLRIKENFTGKTHLYIYENKTALPRAFLARGARFFDSDDALLSEMAATKAAGLRDTVFFRDAYSGRVGEGPFSQGKVSFVAYQPDRIELELDVKGPSLLVLSNNHNRYWRCEADGVEKPILPAFGAFWAVSLDSPARRIVFRYDPPYRLFH